MGIYVDDILVIIMLAILAIPVIYTNMAYWRMTKAERKAFRDAYNEHKRWNPD